MLRCVANFAPRDESYAGIRPATLTGERRIIRCLSPERLSFCQRTIQFLKPPGSISNESQTFWKEKGPFPLSSKIQN
jgi:hypothetical protein